MHQLLALLTGSILSIMILINGNLTVYYGVYFAAVIIHVVGSGFAFILRTLQKERKPLFTHGPKWIYLGGAIGVFTTVFNNFAYGHISLTSIVALGLLGQSVTSLIIDTFGLFGMKKQLLDKRSIPPGLIISVSGILFMLDRSVSYAFLAVLLSLGSGITVVLSRTANARLAEKNRGDITRFADQPSSWLALHHYYRPAGGRTNTEFVRCSHTAVDLSWRCVRCSHRTAQ